MKKNVKKFVIIAVITAVVLTPILFLLFKYISYLNFLEDEENSCKDLFQYFCGYAEEHREVFEDFSEYQISLYDGESPYMDIEREGEHQEWRDIVFDHISRASVNTNDYGVYVIYEKLWEPYDIVICYQNDIYLAQGDERENLVYITDDISVRMRRVR